MIPIAVPVLGTEEAEAARQVVLSGWVSQGPQVGAFEKEFAAAVGAPYACAVSNCTTALHLALLALNVGPGDEVVTVSHSFIATANCIRYCGATPVFVDIDARTYNIDPDRVAAAITPKTRAILVVHQMGLPCDLNALLPLAQAHGVPLIEDAACAAGSEICIDGRWERIGKPHGHIACFSFHPRKVITTGEGGMLTTASREYDKRFRLLRQHAMTVSDTVRHRSSRVLFESYSEVGFNYRMSDMQAAMGRKQLARLPEIVARRRRHAARYAELLHDVQDIVCPFEPEWARSNWQSYCIRLPRHVDQRMLMQRMLERGVATRRGIMCAHREAPYADMKPRHDLRQSELMQDHCILLPLFFQLTESDISQVAHVLRVELARLRWKPFPRRAVVKGPAPEKSGMRT